jgi:hypothetical protein
MPVIDVSFCIKIAFSFKRGVPGNSDKKWIKIESIDGGMLCQKNGYIHLF